MQNEANTGFIHYGGCDIAYSIHREELGGGLVREFLEVDEIDVVDWRMMLETVQPLPGDSRQDMLQRLLDEHWHAIEPLASFASESEVSNV